MKTSEVVFELVLVPPTEEFARATYANAVGKSLDVFLKEESNDLRGRYAGESPWTDALVRTKVRIRTAEHLLWVVRAADIKLWGLVGKSRYVLYHASSGSFLSLFTKEEVPNGKASWRINRELVRIFTEEVPGESRQRRGYKQRLKKPLQMDYKEIYSPSRVKYPVPHANVEDSWFVGKRVDPTLPLDGGRVGNPNLYT